jgi:hypothetical protein
MSFRGPKALNDSSYETGRLAIVSVDTTGPLR